MITGVEPWSFYFINGFLNFNVVFILALFAIPLVEFKVSIIIIFHLVEELSLLQVLFDTLASTLGGKQVVYNTALVYSGLKDSTTSTLSKNYRMTIQSMLVWILVFFTRPHKVSKNAKSHDDLKIEIDINLQ